MQWTEEEMNQALDSKYGVLTVNLGISKHDISRINEYLDSGVECEIFDILHDIYSQIREQTKK